MGAIGQGRGKPALKFMFTAGAGFKYLDSLFDTPFDGAIKTGLEVGEGDLLLSAPIAAVESVAFDEVKGCAKGFALNFGEDDLEAVGQGVAKAEEEFFVQVLLAVEEFLNGVEVVGKDEAHLLVS